ncbi:hypothetical protein FAY30_26430 (plasmid) [Bacillus sp. S3]|uniref:hypothetical protein n=1 Tax=Bacillus sp. S3 TaxID=486398 RepID=UPI00118CD008|nr:hypothetical protein [Bacillus sp. S3]QCJ45479.1 hypothetical protein FAY30_26430 [Bacillus sp. S3]
MSTTVELDISDYTDRKLKAHYQNNEGFNKDLFLVYEYYKSKLLPLVKAQDAARLENELLESIKSQIFNGYFMAVEFLNLEETQISDEWFQQSAGMIAQQLPDMLREITGNQIEEVITYDHLKKLASWLVVNYEGVYPTLMDISLNTACIGAKWALLDEGEKRGLKLYQPQQKGILANFDDVAYLNPESYITCSAMNQLSEVWELIKSNYNTLDKIGEVSILAVPGPMGQQAYFVNVNIRNTFTQEQQEELINSIVIRVMALNDVQRNQITLTGASIEEFYYFTN